MIAFSEALSDWMFLLFIPMREKNHYCDDFPNTCYFRIINKPTRSLFLSREIINWLNFLHQFHLSAYDFLQA